jgi:hypothetical protein
MNELNIHTQAVPGNRLPDLTLKQATLDHLAAVFAQ